MQAEPLKLFDGLVRGAVLAFYDFARLTIAGFLIPIVTIPPVRKARLLRPGFWLCIMAAEGRLSSLTYLVLWVLLTLSFALETILALISGVAGVKQTVDITVPRTVATALLISVIIDLSIRAGFSPIRNAVRREMYKSLARIGVANICLGALLVMVLALRDDEPGFGPMWTLGGILFGPPSLTDPIFYPHPLVFVFSLSLAVVVVRAFAIKNRVRRFGTGVVVTLAVPFLLINIAFWVISAVQLFPLWNSKDPTLKQRLAECVFTSSHIQVTGYIKLEGEASLPIKSNELLVSYYANDKEQFAKVREAQGDIVLSDSVYTRIDLIADYDPQAEDAAKTGHGCDIELRLKRRSIFSDDD